MRAFHEDLFFEEMKPYRPNVEKNPLNICLESNPMLETYGADWEAVLAADLNHIWTLLDVDGKLYITSGIHHVNRVGYYLTERPHYGCMLEFRMGDDAPTMTKRGRRARLSMLNKLIAAEKEKTSCQPS